ncbi:hypothetical protein CFP65_6331 [Kitasatospora sp. MMS16-BH015]|uniref:DUF6528 family protein n=1 Tax=Kitasatospora sp. MMS16-BH015 TaxID=2018025 RepID=UPI000CA129FC|nr:DUF6528 family protein [Kitasatospora sp. MMS16-BH015]AUG80990.1 hypothetical protein CFP65_6331 [Kitasatospora sp. MMS16-BH015]
MSRRVVLGGGVAAAAWAGLGRGAAAQGVAAVDRSLVLAVDQGSRRVLVADANELPWQGERPGLWGWSADDVPGLGGDAWWAVSEAKHRRWRGQRWLVVCATGGLAALVSFPEGRVHWSARPGGNPHSVELLPDGRPVVASADGFLTLYGADATPVRHAFAGAHGLQWDARRRLLWALGDTALTAFTVGARLEAVRSVPLPTPGGHDLALVAADPDLLWVTTNRHVYRYAIPTGTFLAAPADGPGVKSVGDDPRSGQLLTVHPEPGNPSPWCTATLTFTRPDGTARLARASLYKARWLA